MMKLIPKHAKTSKTHKLIFTSSLLLFCSFIFSGRAMALDCEGWVGLQEICYPSSLAALTALCQQRFEERQAEGGLADKWTFSNFYQESEGRVTARCSILYQNEVGDWLIGAVRTGATGFSACIPPAKRIATGSCVLECAHGVATDAETGEQTCKPPADNGCEGLAGNPINFVNGHKVQTEVDYETQGLHRLHFTRYYNSQNNMQRKNEVGWQPGAETAEHFSVEYISGTSTNLPSQLGQGSPSVQVEIQQIEVPDLLFNINSYVFKPRNVALGRMNARWRNNFDKALYAFGGSDPVFVIVYQPQGDDLLFKRNANTGAFEAQFRPGSKMERVYDIGTHWIYVNAQDDKEYYSVKGKLEKIVKRNAYEQNFIYDLEDRLIQVNDSLNRSMQFTYDDLGNLASMTTPEGFTYQYKYLVNGLLSEVFYPDGDLNPFNNPSRKYLYEQAGFPEALTGIIENGARYASYAYQDNGFAVLSQHADGADRVLIDYGTPKQRKVTNAFGKATIYHMDDSDSYIETIEGEPSANCNASFQHYTYDSNHQLVSATDKNGNVTTYVRDVLGREISRTEAVGTPQARTIETEWHGSFNLPTRIIEPDRITNFSYDAKGLLLNKTVTPVAP